MVSDHKTDKSTTKIVDVLNNKNNEVVGDGFIEVDGDAPKPRANPDDMKTNDNIDDGGNMADADGPFTNVDNPVLRENITNPDISTEDN